MTTPASEGLARAAPVLALIVGASAIGAAPILVRLAAAEGVGPTAAAFWRMMFALPVLIVWARASAKGGDGAGGTGLRLALLAGVFFAGDLATWHAGIVRTTAANATLLANLTPVIMAVAGWFLFKERIGRGVALGLAAALAGAALLSGANIQIAPDRALGDLLCALTSIWYAAYLLSVKAARASWPAGRVMLASTIAAAPLLLLIALALGEPVVPQTAAGWALAAALGLIAHALGQGAIAFGLGRLPAANASIVILVQPMMAAIYGWAVFGETLTPVQFAGAGLVLAGVVVAQQTRRTPAMRGAHTAP